ncbi:MAG: hypothetical protein Q8O19_04760, partial [Rectinemataceae bacterium]|nr:hypothetical protein [Rectinemataceae bacterium]
MSIRKQKIALFFALALLFALASFIQHSVSDLARAAALSQSPTFLAHIKCIELGVLLITGGLLALFSWKGQVTRAFQAFLVPTLLFYALATGLLYTQSPCMNQSRVAATFYILVNVSSTLLLALVWGLFSHVYTFKLAALLIFPLFFLFTGIGKGCGLPVSLALFPYLK